MEAKRLIPYSVHLREDIYLKLKEAAKGRKATALVRDAITMIVEGDDSFNGGYNKAIRDMIGIIQEDHWSSVIGVQGTTIADHLTKELNAMFMGKKTS